MKRKLQRRSIRLKGYDYSQAGLYFVTICVQNRRCLFGDVVDGEMVLNEYGKIAEQEWEKLPERFPNMALDMFQIMPNHMHGIIALTDTIGGDPCGRPLWNKFAMCRSRPQWNGYLMLLEMFRRASAGSRTRLRGTDDAGLRPAFIYSSRCATLTS